MDWLGRGGLGAHFLSETNSYDTAHRVGKSFAFDRSYSTNQPRLVKRRRAMLEIEAISERSNGNGAQSNVSPLARHRQRF
jgi:hypothetical protein